MSDDEARRETRRAVDATLGGRGAFAKRAGLDPQTLSTFLNGSRWPQATTLTKIELALGWPLGRITDMREGADRPPARESPPDVIDVSSLSPIQRRALAAVLDAFRSTDAPATKGAADAAHDPEQAAIDAHRATYERDVMWPAEAEAERERLRRNE